MIKISNLRPINLDRRFHGTVAQDTLKDDHAAFTSFMANQQSHTEKSEVRVITNRKKLVTASIGGMACHVYHKNLLDMLRIAYRHNLGIALSPEVLIFSINMELQHIHKVFSALFETLTEEEYETAIADYEAEFQPVGYWNASTNIVEASTMSDLNLASFLAGEDVFSNCTSSLCTSEKFNFTERNITHVKVLPGVPGKIIANIEFIEENQDLLPAQKVYLTKTKELMRAIYENEGNPTFWQNMFYVHFSIDENKSVEGGWIFDILGTTKVTDFYDHVCSIEFVDSISGDRYQLLQGVFSSAVDADSTLTPLNNTKIIYQLSKE